jgi:hypothetical protein
MLRSTAGAALALLALVAPAGAAAVNAYSDFTTWAAAAGSHETEDFTDAALNPGLSVATNVGEVNTTMGLWVDNVARTVGSETTWTFATPIRAFGGTWDPAGWGGPGQGLLISLDGAAVAPEIARDASGVFWGVTSDTPFTQVQIKGGTQEPAAVQESYSLDDMVYAPVPEPGTSAMLGAAMLTLAAARRRRRG